MAYETGTATDYLDLYNRLIAFLTTDPELVAETQNWAQVWTPANSSNSGGDSDNANDVVLRGPGLSAADQVYIGLRVTPDVLNDSASIKMVGMTGIIASAENYDDHVHVSPKVQMFTRGNNPMDYWFIANGRRFVAMVQVSTVYEGLYGGLILPYGDPTQYAYPLFVGGTAGYGGTNGGNGAGEPTDWRDTGTYHSLFHRPQIETGSSNNAASSGNLLDPSGNWLTCAVTDGESHNVGMTPWEFFDSSNWNVFKTSGTQRIGYTDVHSRIIQAYGDDFVLTPVGLVQKLPSVQMYGVLDGIYHVPGRGNSAENIVNVSSNGKDHICFPNVFRTGIDQYFAMELGFPEDSNSKS